MLDVITPSSTIGEVKGVMGPESRYAFIDFGHASVLPYSVALEDAPLRDDLIYRNRSGVGARGPCNPFVADVMFLGSMMERLIRVCSFHMSSSLTTDLTLFRWRQRCFQRASSFWTR